MRRHRVRPASARGLQDHVVRHLLAELKPFPGNSRRHPESQIARLMKNINRVWTVPILIDETGTILAGHARAEAAARLRMSEVPTLTLAGLTEPEKRAVVLADNRLAEQAEWDLNSLRIEVEKLIEIDFDVELTGFSTGEIDLLIDGQSSSGTADPADTLENISLDDSPVSRRGDMWQLGRHRLICGDSLDEATYKSLFEGEIAQLVVTDPPYNVPIKGHAVGRGKTRHREFKMASGEMNSSQFYEFLSAFIDFALKYSCDGSIHFVFIDWRHLPELLSAALPLYAEWKNLLVWNKSNAGQGSFYRSKHELIGVFKKGTVPHINNFGLGGEGRHRANVIDYPSVNSLHPARKGDLALHPTVKPIALIADLIRDCSKRNGIIFDPFGGSGTTILAAERTGRIARAVELDPIYVDVAIARWEKMTGVPARDCATGQTFYELKTSRMAPCPIFQGKQSPRNGRS
jgi:DNA modification methylase